MKSVYELPELGVSKEDFTVPENLSIPIDCEELNAGNQKTKTSSKTDLDALGF